MKTVQRTSVIALVGLSGILLANDCDPPPSPTAGPEFFFARRERLTTPVIDRPGTYDYQASPMRRPDGGLYAWYCGGNSGHDAVFRASLDASNQLEGIQLAVPASGDPGVPDGYHACDVSVIQHHAPGVSWPGGIIDQPGEELYYMYYECAAFVRNRLNSAIVDGPSEICLAASVDGSTWMKYSEELWVTGPYWHFGNLDTVPTPIVAMDEQVRVNCQWDDDDPAFPGEYVVSGVYPLPGGGSSSGCGNRAANYGSGHPSAISLPGTPPSNQRAVWLYSYDSRGLWADRGMVLRKSWDGIHFGPPIDVVGIDFETGAVLHHPDGRPYRLEHGKVRYFDVDVPGSEGGIFIATSGVDFESYFAYSFDGVHFVLSWPPYPPGPAMRLAESRADDQDPDRDLCSVGGAPAIVADRFGIVDRLTYVDVLSGEGKLGVRDGVSSGICHSPLEDAGRGATWGLYLLKGDFGHIVPASALDLCDMYDGRNVRRQRQRSEPSGGQGFIVYVTDDETYGYVDWADFLAKNGNDPYEYQDVSNDTFDRVLSQCPYEGVR